MSDAFQIKPLDYAERWMRDGLDILRPAVSMYQCTVDMTQALQRLDQLRKDGVAATPTHLVLRATARVLAANPDLHQLIAGSRRYHPNSVDIGLSVTGETFVDPVMVIEGADLKSVKETAAEIERRMPDVREADRKLMAAFRRWGWLLPFGFLRRAVLRMLFSSGGFRRKGVGTFQVSTTSVDWALGTTFTTAGVIVSSPVRTQVAVVNGQPGVRPQMKLTLCCDHGVWDGRAATRMIVGVQAELESSETL